MGIALIAPFESLARLSREICSEMGLEVAIHTGTLGEGVRIAKELERGDTDLIISRGVTAEMIRRECSLPVVELEVSSFDIYSSLLAAQELGGSIGVLGHADILRKARFVSEERGVGVEHFAVNDPRTTREMVNGLKRKGVEVIVGDLLACSVAREAGLFAVLVESGKDSLASGLQYSLAVWEYLVQKSEGERQLQTVLDSVPSGTVVASPDGSVLHCNNAARKLLHWEDDCIELNAAEALPGIGWEELVRRGESAQKIVTVNGRTLSVSVHPHSTEGRVASLVLAFQDMREIRRLENAYRRSQSGTRLAARYTFDDIIHESDVMEARIERAKKFSLTDSNILLVGETGTGKELFAQSIHNHSARAGNSFLAINCGALPEDLLESELFGYERGAFTGARESGKPGVFELTHTGTLFLDEVNAMSPKLQTRLLRTLQEGEVMRIGSDTIIPVDVRIIAASNAPLAGEVRKGTFRRDLYYRLNVLDILIPPLRERPGDIWAVFLNVLARKSEEKGIPMPQVGDTLRRRLAAHTWDGNVRELVSYAEKLLVLYPEDVPLDTDLEGPPPGSASEGWSRLEGTLDDMTREIIVRVLNEEGGNVSRAAERLGIGRNTLRRKLRGNGATEHNDE